MFGSVAGAVGRYYKIQDGTRVQVVGVVEDGKYLSVTEDRPPAMFLPFLRSPSSQAWLVVRSTRDPQQLAAAIRGRLRELDAGLPADIDTWNNLLDVVLFPSRVATMALGVLGMMGAMLSITGIFGMAAYSVSKRRRRRSDARSSCWRSARHSVCFSECWPRACWLSSSTRPLPAIPWCWPVSSWPWRCWACWPRGFQRSERCRSIPRYCCATSESRRAYPGPAARGLGCRLPLDESSAPGIPLGWMAAPLHPSTPRWCLP